MEVEPTGQCGSTRSAEVAVETATEPLPAQIQNQKHTLGDRNVDMPIEHVTNGHIVSPRDTLRDINAVTYAPREEGLRSRFLLIIMS